MNTLETTLKMAWDAHAEHPADVAASLPDALPLVTDDAGVQQLATLAHHVLGEHLARWDEGLALLDRLRQLPAAGTEALATITRLEASLGLSAGRDTGLAAMTASDRCRVLVLAASNLAGHDTARSGALLAQAADLAATLPDTDPGVRTLAANANNTASTLQHQPQRDAAQVALMLQAARLAAQAWARAGTWLQQERAEYRLAMCHLAAGAAAQALGHAQRCDDIVRQHGAAPLELFFAAEALGLAARALDNAAGHAAALATAQQAFEALPTDDQGWCRATLDGLAAA